MGIACRVNRENAKPFLSVRVLLIAGAIGFCWHFFLNYGRSVPMPG